MNTYAIRKKSTGLFRHASYKQFSATADQAKVFSSIAGAKTCAAWAIYFDNPKVKYTALSKIHRIIKQQYEIVEFANIEIKQISLT